MAAAGLAGTGPGTGLTNGPTNLAASSWPKGNPAVSSVPTGTKDN